MEVTFGNFAQIRCSSSRPSRLRMNIFQLSFSQKKQTLYGQID